MKCSKEVATAIRGAIILAKLSIVPVRRGFWGNKIGKPHTVPTKVRTVQLLAVLRSQNYLICGPAPLFLAPALAPCCQYHLKNIWFKHKRLIKAELPEPPFLAGALEVFLVRLFIYISVNIFGLSKHFSWHPPHIRHYCKIVMKTIISAPQHFSLAKQYFR